MIEWIDINDKLPEKSGKYLVTIYRARSKVTFFEQLQLHYSDVSQWTYKEVFEGEEEDKRIYRKEWEFDHCYREHIISWAALPEPMYHQLNKGENDDRTK